MIAAMRSLFDRWRGSGAHAATVPPMDGVLGPNQAIEEAQLLLEADAPDNLASDGTRMVFSSGRAVLGLRVDGPSAAAEPIAGFDHPVSAVALHADAGMAVGLEGGGVQVRGGRHDGKTMTSVGNRPAVCPAALLFADADTLFVALGSQQNAPSMWRHDLMRKNASGSVWRYNLATGEASCVADRLAWPGGLLAGRDGGLTVSESWRNRLVELRTGTKPSVVLADIAGYPGRLSPASGGGSWLSVFAPRSQLVEFVLREDDYRTGMLAEIEPEYWVAPSLSAAKTLLEPMQLGGLKQLGVLKPWAPTRSYGLVIGLDGGHEPLTSFHSRADGRRHGITSALEHGGQLILTSKGGNSIVSIPLGSKGVAA